MESHAGDHLIHCTVCNLNLKIFQCDIKERLDITEYLNNFSRKNHTTYFIAYIVIVFKAHHKNYMVFKFDMLAGMHT